MQHLVQLCHGQGGRIPPEHIMVILRSHVVLPCICAHAAAAWLHELDTTFSRSCRPGTAAGGGLGALRQPSNRPPAASTAALCSCLRRAWRCRRQKAPGSVVTTTTTRETCFLAWGACLSYMPTVSCTVGFFVGTQAAAYLMSDCAALLSSCAYPSTRPAVALAALPLVRLAVICWMLGYIGAMLSMVDRHCRFMAAAEVLCRSAGSISAPEAQQACQSPGSQSTMSSCSTTKDLEMQVCSSPKSLALGTSP